VEGAMLRNAVLGGALGGLVALPFLLGFSAPAMADEVGDEGSRLDPAAGQAFYEGNALLVEARYEEALEAFDRALEISPGFHRVHLYRSRAYVSLGDTEGARSALEQFEAAAATDAERSEAAAQRKRIDALLADLADAFSDNAEEATPGDEGEAGAGAGQTESEQPVGGTAAQDEHPVSIEAPATDDVAATPADSQMGAGADKDQSVEATIEPAAANIVPKPPAVRLGLQGGYSLTRGDSTYHWGTIQARFEATLGKGFSARIQGGLGMQRDEDVVYFMVPAAVGMTWRAPIRPSPYLDAHVLMVFYNDGKSADGSAVAGAPRAPGIGGGGGGGVEIVLIQTRRINLCLAPEVQVGWAGIFVLQGGVSVRLAPVRASGS